MESSLIKIYKSLRPFAFLYGIGVRLRNQFFNWGLKPSESYQIPVICIGNLTVGGTGKTPHVEYLVRLLSPGYRVAVLSRGYKRRSKGFLLADSDTSVRLIGDEPWQIKRKFPEVGVAVDKNRRRGIRELMKQKDPEYEVILLDDAFQHRYVQAGITILLTDYNRLFCDDELLPAGRLREPASGKKRAQVVVVTKCPANMKPMDIRVISKRMKLSPYQQLYFSSFTYGDLEPLYPGPAPVKRTLESLAEEEVLLLTGIALPEQLQNDLQPYSKRIHPLFFQDHHNFTAKDIRRIKDEFGKLGDKKLIITTEKDAARLLRTAGIDEEIQSSIYVLPVEVTFLQNQHEPFNQYVLNYIRNNKRHNILTTGR